MCPAPPAPAPSRSHRPATPLASPARRGVGLRSAWSGCSCEMLPAGAFRRQKLTGAAAHAHAAALHDATNFGDAATEPTHVGLHLGQAVDRKSTRLNSSH